MDINLFPVSQHVLIVDADVISCLWLAGDGEISHSVQQSFDQWSFTHCYFQHTLVFVVLLNFYTVLLLNSSQPVIRTDFISWLYVQLE